MDCRRELPLVLAVLAWTVAAHQLPSVATPTVKQTTLLPRALELLSDEEPCVLLFDLEAFEANLRAVISCFPPSALHAIAMKANPLASCLLIAKDHGFGVEVASPAELEHALQLGFRPEKIVMDSPAKTRRDLRKALTAGVHINADNFEELERIDSILAAEFGGGGHRGLGSCQSRIGVRVNPQYGEGAIATTGTIAPTSKFGVPLMEARAELLERFGRFKWLSSVHCHVGSQGCEKSLLVSGARSVLDLAAEINSAVSYRQVTITLVDLRWYRLISAELSDYRLISATLGCSPLPAGDADRYRRRHASRLRVRCAR